MRLNHCSTTHAVYIGKDEEVCIWLGSCSSVVRALEAQVNDLGSIPSDSLPYFTPLKPSWSIRNIFFNSIPTQCISGTNDSVCIWMP